jgi:hypothetical protein
LERVTKWGRGNACRGRIHFSTPLAACQCGQDQRQEEIGSPASTHTGDFLLRRDRALGLRFLPDSGEIGNALATFGGVYGPDEEVGLFPGAGSLFVSGFEAAFVLGGLSDNEALASVVAAEVAPGPGLENCLRAASSSGSLW